MKNLPRRGNRPRAFTVLGEQLTVFRIHGVIGLARGRQEPDKTIQMTPEEAYELGGFLFDAADLELALREDDNA